MRRSGSEDVGARWCCAAVAPSPVETEFTRRDADEHRALLGRLEVVRREWRIADVRAAFCARIPGALSVFPLLEIP